MNLFDSQAMESGEKSTPEEGTEPITPPESSSELKSVSLDKLMGAAYLVGSATSVGRQRDHNEDALFTLTTNLIGDNTVSPFGLYIVADGMGGHQYGERASNTAIRAMSDYILSRVLPDFLGFQAEKSNASIVGLMNAGIKAGHQAIKRYAPGGGTTLTGMLFYDEEITICHIGDSRAYRISNNGMVQQLTTDHSVVRRLEELGQITPDEAAVHPQRNVLYRALGQTETIEAEMVSIPLEKDGYYLICSDGLWGSVGETEMMDIITSSESPQQASESLLNSANSAGGPDNISVIIVEVPG
jgi:serine/threonine protein phosphatase PrpC